MTSAKKVKPIIFSPAMAQAIYEGRKTQTRRIVKPQPDCGPDNCYLSHDGWTWGKGSIEDGDVIPIGIAPEPKYQPGDVLYVREAFLHECAHCDDDNCGTPIIYKGAEKHPESFAKRWRPSIHMPAWAARSYLRVKSVRCERVQDISREDCWAEGINPDETGDHVVANKSSIENFAALWDSIHGRGAWQRNDWVWVYSFERIEKP